MLDVILFTNRNLMVFDEDGKQTPWQNAVTCYDINRPLLEKLILQPATYHLAKLPHWKHEITCIEFQCLLGMRTKERDLSDERRDRADGDSDTAKWFTQW